MSVETSADERLARLAARRRAAPAPPPDPAPAGEVTAPSPSAPRTSRRVPPARSAKIITVGVSTTSMLGVMAAMAIADRPAAPPAASQPALAATEPPAATMLVAMPLPVALDVDVSVATPPPSLEPVPTTIAAPAPTRPPAPMPAPAPTAAPAPPPPPAPQAQTSGS